ncbi:MAG: SUMF1/EgtB/PvdO family nonheme iron enzyme [Planctomycetota bacterium]|nr:SUMF1/EgtB/PvdO family nonheme iron enzyme [Planctomycetota bacterium]
MEKSTLALVGCGLAVVLGGVALWATGSRKADNSSNAPTAVSPRPGMPGNPGGPGNPGTPGMPMQGQGAPPMGAPGPGPSMTVNGLPSNVSMNGTTVASGSPQGLTVTLPPLPNISMSSVRPGGQPPPAAIQLREQVVAAVRRVAAIPASPTIDKRRAKVNEQFKIAETAAGQQKWADALAGYQTTYQSCDALLTAAAEITAADKAKAAADTSRAAAEKVEAAEDSQANWTAGESANAEATKAFEQDHFREAADKWTAASKQYDAAQADAVNQRVERLLRAARANMNATGAMAARDRLREALELQADNAAALELMAQAEKYLVVTNAMGMRFLRVPAGKFFMGTPTGQPGRGEPRLRVTLTRGYLMSETEVTQEQYRLVMEENPSAAKGDDLPVTNLTWTMATEFCKKLSAQEGKTYRLPTEAEWEYACRGGTDEPYAGTAKLGDIGWSLTTSKNQVHPVRKLKPNPWGFYDMEGNIWEWCADLMTERDPDAVITDPGLAPVDPKKRIPAVAVRGGSFRNYDVDCRAASRYPKARNIQSDDIGFRVVLEAE